MLWDLSSQQTIIHILVLNLRYFIIALYRVTHNIDDCTEFIDSISYIHGSLKLLNLFISFVKSLYTIKRICLGEKFQDQLPERFILVV